MDLGSIHLSLSPRSPYPHSYTRIYAAVAAGASDFERTRFSSRKGDGLLQAFRQALRARANFAQVFESIDPRAVTVAPAEIQSVVSDGLHVKSLQTGRDAPRLDHSSSAELFDTGGAGTVLA